MKIEKIYLDPKLEKQIHNYPMSAPLESDIILAKKINEIIAAMSCCKCGEVVVLYYKDMCFDCYSKEPHSK